MVVSFSLANTILGSGKILAISHLVESCIILQVVKGTDFGIDEAWLRMRVPPPGFGYLIAVTLNGGFTSPEP